MLCFVPVGVFGMFAVMYGRRLFSSVLAITERRDMGLYICTMYYNIQNTFGTVVALYTEACTVVSTYAGLSESFEVTVGLHPGSVLSPLLFAAVMDVVSGEARSGLPSELLYADDLVIMAPTMEQLGRRVDDWRASLLGKGLRVNAGKSKVLVGCSGGKMIVNSGKWPCGVCGKGVQANSVQCTVHKN